MVTPDEEYDQYVKDPRTVCKFGATCYQRNPLHHQKYKHPPKKRLADEGEPAQKAPKKQKVAAEREKPVRISNDISDSDSSNEVDTVEKLQNDSDNEAPKEEETSDLQEGDDEPKKRTPSHYDKKEFIKGKFLVDMPEDFYLFWDFCESLNKNDPAKAFASVGLLLVGPYDVLADKFTNVVEKSAEEYLVHWRYFYDPPEFQTVLKGNDSTGYHMGYFRDDPKQAPAFVAGNHSRQNGEFMVLGGNIFAAVCHYLDEAKKSCDPFKKLSISKVYSNLKKHAEKLNVDLSERTAAMRERDKKVLARSFNKLGLIVPYNRKTQVGYRHLCVSDKELRKLLERITKASDQQRDKVLSELQSVLTATSIATDECDFGTGIELGWDILAHEVDSINTTIERFLTTAYQLLQRDAFASIISAHMKNRRKGTTLSIL